MAGRRPPRTESQPVMASRLPALKTRSASQPPEEKLRQGNDEIFGIMVKRQMQMRKDLVQLRQVSLPRLDGKPTPNHQEQAAQLIASMAEAVSNYGYLRKSKGEVEMEPGHWPSLVQKAAAAAESAQHAEVTGTGERRGLSKSSLEEPHLSPFQSVVLERRREREAKAARRREAEAAPEKVDRVDSARSRPQTPSYPSPFKEQPSPPPMPPEWSKGLWEQRKRELAEERQRRQASRDPFSEPPPPRVPEHGTHNAHVPPEDHRAPWRPWRCPIFPNWSAKFQAPEDPEPEPPPEPRVHRATRVEPRAAAPDLPGRAPAGPAGCPCCPPGAGRHGNRWNWGSAFFANGKVQPLVEAHGETASRRTRELIAQLEEEMAKTRQLPLEERKKVFKDLQRRFHPDKNLLEEEAATLAFQHLMDSRKGYLRAA